MQSGPFFSDEQAIPYKQTFILVSIFSELELQILFCILVMIFEGILEIN
jgi:hypothetical protein